MSDPVLNADGTQATVLRNGASLNLITGVFSKLSEANKGKKFPYPEILESNWDTVVTFCELPFIVNNIQKKVRAAFAEIFLLSWDKDTGTLDQTDWLERVQDFTEGEEKKSVLEDQKADLATQFSAITESADFSANPTNYVPQLEKIGKEVANIDASLKRIQQDIDTKTAKRNATKAANAAKAAAANTASMAAKQTVNA